MCAFLNFNNFTSTAEASKVWHSLLPAHPELPDSDPVYNDLLPSASVDGGAGPRPTTPRMPDAGAHLIIVPGSLTRHPLNSWSWSMDSDVSSSHLDTGGLAADVARPHQVHPLHLRAGGATKWIGGDAWTEIIVILTSHSCSEFYHVMVFIERRLTTNLDRDILTAVSHVMMRQLRDIVIQLKININISFKTGPHPWTQRRT